MDTRNAAGQLQRGLLIEVDLTILGGTELCLEACRARLARAGIKLDADLFRRFLFGRPLARGISALAAKLEHPVEDAATVAAECTAAYLDALRAAAEKVPANNAILGFAKDAAAHAVKVGLVTQLPEEVARQVFAGVLGDRIVVVAESPSGVCLHGWEGWRRAARKLQIRERLCLAVSSPGSSRGALAAAMRLVVVLDPFQGHVDCSGADQVVESFTSAVQTAALGMLKVA